MQPAAGAWIAAPNPDLFLLKQFALLNADLLGAEADATMKFIMHELQKAFTGSDPAICRDAIMEQLAKYKAHPVMYVIDEHNELWKLEGDQLPVQRMPFYVFASWARCTAGVRTLSRFVTSCLDSGSRCLHWCNSFALSSSTAALRTASLSRPCQLARKCSNASLLLWTTVLLNWQWNPAAYVGVLVVHCRLCR